MNDVTRDFLVRLEGVLSEWKMLWSGVLSGSIGDPVRLLPSHINGPLNWLGLRPPADPKVQELLHDYCACRCCWRRLLLGKVGHRHVMILHFSPGHVQRIAP